FFQAEDGIRDKLVTGVQTCALPICAATAGLRLTHFQARRPVPARRAVTGSPACQRLKSSARAPAVSYRRVGSFSRHLRATASREIGRAACRGKGEDCGESAKCKNRK